MKCSRCSLNSRELLSSSRRCLWETAHLGRKGPAECGAGGAREGALAEPPRAYVRPVRHSWRRVKYAE